MNSKTINLLTALVIIVTAFQGIIPAMPLNNPTTITIISSVAMFVVSTLTVLKQYFSAEIGNKALNPTLWVAALAIIGGINELIKVLPMSELTSQWVRFGITFLTMAINLTSKLLYPTPETISKI